MGESLKFDYYYGVEAEQFSFYRVPHLLIKDEENRAYIIYPVDNIMKDLGCSKPTCIKIMRELDTLVADFPDTYSLSHG